MLKLTQKEVELDVAKILEHGDIADIAPLTSIGYKYLDAQLSPTDERKSHIYGFLEIICAYDETHPERGEELWQLVKRIREASRAKNPTGCADAEAGKFAKESGEAISARLQGKSKYEQLKEAVEAESQATKYKEAIIAEINAEKETCNSSRSRLKLV